MIITGSFMALWKQLLLSVNLDTLLPKFPSEATECVKLLSSMAQNEENYQQLRDDALGTITEPDSPEMIFYTALAGAATQVGEARKRTVLAYMPFLEAALNKQRRCRVCGCTDYNGCVCGCYWVGEDLCSECAGEGGGEA